MPRPEPVRFASPAGLARRARGPVCAVCFVLLALGFRLLLGRLLPELSIFTPYYPAILGAALVGGELSAAIALVLSFTISWGFLAYSPTLSTAAVAVNMLLYLLTGAFVGATGSRLRSLLQRRRSDFIRLAEREARYRALFEGVAEGFALLEAIWDEDGRLADFVVVEANPALLAMFNTDASILGRRQSELVKHRDPGYMTGLDRAFRGRSVRLEVPSGRRWFDVRLSPVGRDRVGQLVVDITDRKAAESRQVEMFDELNHRVKNNLAAVAAMLGMQARVAENLEVREHLQKAVDRIETIGHVHASLYRAGATDEVDFAAYLRRLCERLAATIVDGPRIRVEVAAEPVTTALDQAVALGLIVNELVTNAAKYAYPPPASGVIRVALHKLDDGLSLSVSDEGVGLRQDSPTKGIGMRLVRSLVQQCRAEMEVGSGPGAAFVIRAPDPCAPATETAQSQLL